MVWPYMDRADAEYYVEDFTEVTDAIHCLRNYYINTSSTEKKEAALVLPGSVFKILGGKLLPQWTEDFINTSTVLVDQLGGHPDIQRSPFKGFEGHFSGGAVESPEDGELQWLSQLPSTTEFPFQHPAKSFQVSTDLPVQHPALTYRCIISCEPPFLTSSLDPPAWSCLCRLPPKWSRLCHRPPV